MNRKNLLAAAATAAIALGAADSAVAQSEAPKERRVTVNVEAHMSPTMSRMADELGRNAANYWTGRLNAYKARIDRILSPADLDKLNRLRVRFGVMLAEHADVSANIHELRDGDERAIVNGDGTDENVTVHRGPKEDGVVVHRSNHEENIIVHRNDKDGDGEATDNNDKKIRREVIVKVDGGTGGMELFTMHQDAKELSSNYRDEFDKLGTDVIADVIVFMREMHEAGEKFVQNNRVAIEKEEDGEKMSIALTDAKSVVNSFDSEEKRAMLQMAYSLFAEPIVMLYDGADLKQLFSQGPLSAAVTGLNLPASSALKQNIPNPATTSTTISYTLDEPSTATTLRLFNASGELVGTYDQGAREVGDHAATVDLSSLPNGMYLYHLKVQSASGERVYSKAMQVAR